MQRFAVPEGRSDGLRVGAGVRVRFEEEGIEVSGEVTTIAPEIDAGTRLLFAEARVRVTDEQAAVLRVGTVARVRFG